MINPAARIVTVLKERELGIKYLLPLALVLNLMWLKPYFCYNHSSVS